MCVELIAEVRTQDWSQNWSIFLLCQGWDLGLINTRARQTRHREGAWVPSTLRIASGFSFTNLPKSQQTLQCPRESGCQVLRKTSHWTVRTCQLLIASWSVNNTNYNDQLRDAVLVITCDVIAEKKIQTNFSTHSQVLFRSIRFGVRFCKNTKGHELWFQFS